MPFRIYTEFFIGKEGYPDYPVLLDDKERAKPLKEVHRPMEVGDHLIKKNGSIWAKVNERSAMIMVEPQPREIKLPRSWNSYQGQRFPFGDRNTART